MERFLGLVAKGVGPQYWTALGRTRGAKGHQALQHMSLMADPETRFRVELAYANKDRFIVERYLSMMRAIPPAPELASDTRMDKWTDAMADWADDALKAHSEMRIRLAAKWSMLFRDCHAEQFMPYAFAQLWDDVDGIDLYGLMAIGMLLLRWNELDGFPDEDAIEQLAQLRRVVKKFAKLALGGEPKATWTRRGDAVVVRAPLFAEIQIEGGSRTILPRDNGLPWTLDTLIEVATSLHYGNSYEAARQLRNLLLDVDLPDDKVWNEYGPLGLNEADAALDASLAKTKRFHRRPVLCPLHAEALVEREMRDLDNDPDGCWTATIADYLVALAGEALTHPRTWYTERDLRDHVERCATPREWRPALYDLWKRLDGVVHTDVRGNQRKLAIVEADRLFRKETERVAAKVQ